MKNLLFLALAVALLASCRSTRKISSVMVIKDTSVAVVSPVEDDSARIVRETMSRLGERRIDFNTFAAKVKVDYRDSKDRKYDFNAFIRIRKDSVIWVSVIAALGIEAFRVIIRPDSVAILDKLEKTIQYQSVDYLQQITQLPFDFETLQDLIIGNPVYMKGDIKSFQDRGSQYVLSMIGPFFKHFMTIEKSNTNLLLSKLDDIDPGRSRTASLAYDDYQPNGTWQFANLRRITLAEKTKVDVDMEFKQVEFNKPQNYPFSVPRNYKLK
jgi:Domain of unknown function (DUF4292)